MGAIKAAIWKNDTGNGVRYNTTFSRLYKDGDEWKNADSFGRDDLLVLGKVADQEITWKDFIWEMLCNDSRLGGSSDPEGPGMALLEYSFEVSEKRAEIGRAAKECLSDPRMRQNRWHDARV